jgi:Relaxase/Mobilisation nuclease domain
MLPVIAAMGTSFKGVAAYYLHDKEAETKERVAWTHTENLPTDDPEKAWKVMAWTANHQSTIKSAAGTRATGRKLEKPVFAFSVSWHPEQKPDKAHMLETAKAISELLGLSGHQALYVCHNDEPQPHVHVLVNRVHPETGKAATLNWSKTKLSQWSLAYEKQHGKIYCQAREKNARNREQGKPERERNPIIQAAWRESDNGKSFQAALAAKGFTLARGNRRFVVVVDRWGKAINPVRHLPDVRAAAFKARLADLDLNALPTAAAVQKRCKQEQRKEYAINRKFEKWSAEYLNKNQDRQIEERAKLSDRYHRLIENKKEELAKHYQLDERRQAIEQLQERVKNPSLFRRVTRKAAQDREELAAQQATYRDAQQRLAESVGAIETERALAVADQTATHEREKELARQYLEDRKPEFYKSEELEVQKERSNRGGGRDRDNDGGRERIYCWLNKSPLPRI